MRTFSMLLANWPACRQAGWWLFSWLFFDDCCTVKSWLAIKVPRLCPLCSFAAAKSWKVLSCSWFCCCSSTWCFHDCLFFDFVDDCCTVKSWLAIKVPRLRPLCSFTIFKSWKVLSCFRFCCCSVARCFHNFYIFSCCF